MRYLEKFSRFILKDELANLDGEILFHVNEKDALHDEIKKILLEKEKLEKKIKRMDTPENILLSYYRVDNIGANGMPPSYLNPQNKNDYTQNIHELESVYRNRAFREMMAWSLNFHANMAVSDKIRNELGDEIEIPTDHAKHMISGIKAIWQLVVNAHKKDQELTPVSEEEDGYDILETYNEA